MNHKMFLNPEDCGISKELFMYKVHEPVTTSLLQQNLRPGMTVVDIGSNIGYYVIIESLQVGPKGHIIAFEPFPDSFKILQKNISLNSLKNTVKSLQKAIGSRTGAATFYTYPMANWNSFTKHGESARKIEIDMTTLDCLEEIKTTDFVRMDVEGFEVEVIQGMSSLLGKWRPMLCIELHPHIIDPQKLVEMVRYLESLGYGLQHSYARMDDFLGLEHRIDTSPSTIEALLSEDGPIIQRQPWMAWFSAT